MSQHNNDVSSPNPNEGSNISTSSKPKPKKTPKPKSRTQGRRVVRKKIYKTTLGLLPKPNTISPNSTTKKSKSKAMVPQTESESISISKTLPPAQQKPQPQPQPEEGSEHPNFFVLPSFSSDDNRESTAVEYIPQRKGTVDSFAPPIPSTPKPSRIHKFPSFKTMPLRRRGSSSGTNLLVNKNGDLPFSTLIGLLEPKIPTLISAARRLFYCENSFSHIFESFDEPLINNIRNHLDSIPIVKIGPHCSTDFNIPSYVNVSTTNLVVKKSKTMTMKIQSKLAPKAKSSVDAPKIVSIQAPPQSTSATSGWEKTCASAAINPSFTEANNFSISLAPRNMQFSSIEKLFFSNPKLLATLFESEFPNASQVFLSGPDGQSKKYSLLGTISLLGSATSVLSIDRWLTDVLVEKTFVDIIPRFTNLSILSLTNSPYLFDSGCQTLFRSMKNSELFSTLEILNFSGSLHDKFSTETWKIFSTFLSSCSRLAFLGLSNCSCFAEFSKTFTTDATLKTSAQSFASALSSITSKHLKRLDFSHNPKIGSFLSNVLFRKIFRKNSQVRIVSFRNCGLSSCDVLANGVKSCHNLLVLDISFNPKVNIKPLLSVCYSHPTLKFLKISGCNLDGSELVSFLDCPFSKCSSLDISSNQIIPKHIYPSLASNKFLHHINLSNCSLKVRSSQSDRSSGSHSLLYNIGQHPRLQWVNLSKNPSLFLSGSPEALKGTDSSSAAPSSSVSSYFTSSANPLSHSFNSLLKGKYSHLNLAQVSLPGSLLRSTLSLAPELSLPECVFLNLSDNPLTDEGVVSIGSWLKSLSSPHRLKQLHLSNVGMTSLGLTALTNGLDNCPSMTHLIVSNNEISKLPNNWQPTSLRYFDISFNSLGSHGTEDSINAFWLNFTKFDSNLSFLNLANNSLTRGSLAKFANFAKYSHNLRHLNLDSNPLASSTSLIADALPQFPKLEILRCNWFGFSTKTMGFMHHLLRPLLSSNTISSLAIMTALPVTTTTSPQVWECVRTLMSRGVSVEVNLD